MLKTKSLFSILWLTLLSMIILGNGCAPSPQAEELPINRDVAIMIAAVDVPSTVLKDASIYTLWNDSNWIVHYFLRGNNIVTKSELGWSASLNTSFKNEGLLPVDTYGLLTFTIDRMTGTVVSRQASDSILLGFHGAFNTEPPERMLMPLWSVIASGIGGLIVGAFAMWFIVRRKTIIS